jgi:hypothetical protein
VFSAIGWFDECLVDVLSEEICGDSLKVINPANGHQWLEAAHTQLLEKKDSVLGPASIA